jgi:hypothetical protein
VDFYVECPRHRDQRRQCWIAATGFEALPVLRFELRDLGGCLLREIASIPNSADLVGQASGGLIERTRSTRR